MVVSESVAYHDADAQAFGYELGQIPQMPAQYAADAELLELTTEAIEAQSLTAQKGLIVSGDSFIGTNTQRETIRVAFPEALAVEMEATAIAQTCYQFNVPFIITRAISDLANGEAELSFEAFLKKAAQSSSQVVENLVNKIGQKGD